AGQRLPAQRRLAAAHRLRRRAANALRRGRQARAHLYAGLRGTRAVRACGRARALDRYLFGRRDGVLVLLRQRAAARARAAAEGRARAGASRVGRALFRRAARHRRLVPAPRSPRAPAERVRAAEGAAGREGAAAALEMKYALFQDSRIGTRRMNQDRVGHWSTSSTLLMALADGLGGHPHGEVAA